MFRSILTAAISIVSLSGLQGCASIVSGKEQTVFVETRHAGERVIGAVCQLDNGKASFHVTTPGSVAVQTAYDDMTVKCEKEGLPSGTAIVKSGTKPMALGNFFIGGLIGVAIDSGSGAAYDYPTLITVIMEEAVAQAPIAPDSSVTVRKGVSAEQK